MKQTCEVCKHWKLTLYDMGECKKINEKIEVELVTGWDGGYVKVIETGVDFACNLFEGEKTMNELTREQYQRQWENLNAIVNPKPPEHIRQQRIEDYQRQREARARTQRMFKELNAKLIKEIMAGK